MLSENISFRRQRMRAMYSRDELGHVTMLLGHDIILRLKVIHLDSLSAVKCMESNK